MIATVDVAKRLLFLGRVVGVSPEVKTLSATLPHTVRPLFQERYGELRPSLPWVVLGTLLGLIHYPYRTYRNPLPSTGDPFATHG